MIAIDTNERYTWFLNALESDNFQVVSRKWTEEEKEKLSKEIADYKAMQQETAKPVNKVKN